MENNNNSLFCFTIGHSDYTTERFAELLKKQNINCLVDIRSSPYSQHTPQFNRELLMEELKKENILYVYMGNKLGGRYTNPELLFPDGKVDYDKVKQTKNFISGIEKVIQGIKKGYSIALMCSEKEPFDCHRFILVACELERRGVTVKHVLGNGNTILNTDLEKKLLSKYKVDYQQHCFFTETKTREKALEEARRKRNIDIAFSATEHKK
ncbi:MAG: DUF488 domain-containing protein [Candidatus Omnitrophota bacterium]|nr:DUF488 domain-containing protein [Candidatus Omnitrophota bacterium]